MKIHTLMVWSYQQMRFKRFIRLAVHRSRAPQCVAFARSRPRTSRWIVWKMKPFESSRQLQHPPVGVSHTVGHIRRHSSQHMTMASRNEPVTNSFSPQFSCIKLTLCVRFASTRTCLEHILCVSDHFLQLRFTFSHSFRFLSCDGRHSTAL